MIVFSMKGADNMANNKGTDLFCVECNKNTKHRYIGIEIDGSRLYYCTKCGYEHTLWEGLELCQNS